MPNLFKIATAKASSAKFNQEEMNSIQYHDIFDYPLSLYEMIRWRAGAGLKNNDSQKPIISKNGYFFLEGKEGIIYKRTLRKRISERKMRDAKKAADFLSILPLVKMVAVTGSLAMGNASDESDIDLMIVTKKGRLWTTRACCYLLLKMAGFKVRKVYEKNQKDKLCLNIWLDESELTWNKNRNIYTAHEIAQIVPLVNKEKTYEKFLYKNSWILRYWPNAVKIQKSKFKSQNYHSKFRFIERLAYRVQYIHMKPKMTREAVTPTRALFHPLDWGGIVLRRMK